MSAPQHQPENPPDLATALDAYEDALIRGLCPQGALEAAISAAGATPQTLTLDDLDNAMKARTRDDMIRIKRIYDPPTRNDGVRVLIDRLWPRGIAKSDARLEAWLKELAPSAALRKWFAHDPSRWEQFQQRYERELNGLTEQIDTLRELAGKSALTLLYAAKDETHNNAVVLRNYLLRHKTPTRRKSRPPSR